MESLISLIAEAHQAGIRWCRVDGDLQLRGPASADPIARMLLIRLNDLEALLSRRGPIPFRADEEAGWTPEKAREIAMRRLPGEGEHHA